MAGHLLTGKFPRRRMIQIVAGNLVRHVFQGAARNWARNLGSTAPALGSMSLLLVMTGLVGLVGFALHNLRDIETSQASLLHIYLRDDAAGPDVILLMSQLESDPRVASVTYISKDRALLRAQRIPGLPDLANSSESNPFPASLDVQIKAIADVGAIDSLVRYDPIVDPVIPTSYDSGAYERIQTVLLGMAVAGFAFLGMLGFVAVSVTMNSIKAAIHSRRDEIAIMQLVGAPRWMVSGPFVIEGAITGLLAGAVAGLITFGLALTGISAGASAFAQFAPGVTITVAALAAAAVMLTGMGLGSGSSLLSLRRHMES